MEFFILYPGDTNKDLYKEENQLGEISFKKFWKKLGFDILEGLVKKDHPVVTHENTIIRSSKGDTYTVGEFYEYLVEQRINLK